MKKKKEKIFTKENFIAALMIYKRGFSIMWFYIKKYAIMTFITLSVLFWVLIAFLWLDRLL